MPSTPPSPVISLRHTAHLRRRTGGPVAGQLAEPSFVPGNAERHESLWPWVWKLSPWPATVPVPPGGGARRRWSPAGLHQRRAAASGAEGRWDPPGAGGGHQAGAAAHPSSGPAGLPGLPAPLHAHPQGGHLQPSG